MQNLKKLFIASFLCLFSIIAFSQENSPTPENMFTSNGKLGVVVAVVITILAGILFYLVSLDKKISQLENKK
jgi:hypothetical protein